MRGTKSIAASTVDNSGLLLGPARGQVYFLKVAMGTH